MPTNKPTHTPGPRDVEENGSIKRQQVYECGCIVSYCLCGCNNAPEQRDCAVHRAAPELLEVIKHLFDTMPGGDVGLRLFPASDIHTADFNAALDQARAAIAKAEGK